MKIGKVAQKTAAVLALCFSMSSVSYAASYSDVPGSHWAYSSISRLAEQGVMVGDSTGKYYPDKAVDKFYTVKVLAKMAGYKYVNLTTEESLYINRAYEANKGIIQQYSKAFTKWDSTADKEIAYLLEKGILQVTDLNQFVVRLSDGTEKLRALSREEYCAFLVRFMGKTAEADSATYSGKFADDAALDAAYKNDVYYLKSQGVVSGDTNNKFNPNSAVTKAAMAVMADKVLTIASGGSSASNGQNGSAITTITSVKGTLYKVYPALNAVQISDSGTVSTYKLSDTISIYVDGSLRTIGDLAEGMNVTGVITNAQLSELRAQSVPSNGVAAPTTNQTATAPSAYTRVEGTVSDIVNDGVAQSVKIKIPSITAKGVISYTEKTYIVANGCTVKRNNMSTSFTDIRPGEVIYAGVSGNSVYTIELEEKNVTIKGGRLINKRYDAVGNRAVLTVSYGAGKQDDFFAIKDSVLERKGVGDCRWNSLRVGDTIDLTAEYSNIRSLYAAGEKTSEIGWISEVFIAEENSFIKVREDENRMSQYKVYYIADSSVDLYDLTLDSKIRVKLDSEEVEGITVISRASKSASMTGYIYNIKSDYMSFAENLKNDSAQKIYLDSDTKYVDATEGTTVKRSFLEDDMQVHITVRNENGKIIAKTVTVIDYND